MQENASTKIKILKNVAYYAFIMYNYENQEKHGEKPVLKDTFLLWEKLL